MKYALRFLIDTVFGFIAASTYLYYVHDTPVGPTTIGIAIFVTAVFRLLTWSIKLKTIYAVSKTKTDDGQDAVDVVALAPSKDCTLHDQNQAVCQFAKEDTIVIDIFGFACFKMGFITTALKFKIKPDWAKYIDPDKKPDKDERDAIHKKFLDRIAKLKKDKDDEDKK